MFSQAASKILAEIKSSRNILLHLHPGPDGDSLGSCLAFYYFLRSQKKSVTLIGGDSPLPENLKFFPGSEKVEPKNIFDLNLHSYDLFLILDSSNLDQVSKIKPVSFPDSLKTIVIDHHSTNQKYGHLNYLDTTSPATAQIVYQLLKFWRQKITPKMATNLFLGIYTDTGGFKYPRTDHRTFQIASDLSRTSPNFPDYVFKIENNNQAKQLEFKGLAFSSIKTYFSNRVAVSAISNRCLAKNQILKNHTEKSDIANQLKSVIGWDIGACLVESEPGLCYLSLRVRDHHQYDVAKIATACGVGGGHPSAAGAVIRLPIRQANQKLLDTIHNLYPELGHP